MKPAIIALCAFISTSSAALWHPFPATAPYPREPTYSIYDLAAEVTGAPSAILAGIAYAESSGGFYLSHPDPDDCGYFGLHETLAYHAERAAKWGEYDADNPTEAAIISGYLYMENRARLDSDYLAISAHLQGVNGTLDHGPALWYIIRVLRAHEPADRSRNQCP